MMVGGGAQHQHNVLVFYSCWDSSHIHKSDPPESERMMLLRSSSTPVLGSLLSSSFTDSPNHPEACHAIKHLPPTTSSHHKLSLHQTGSLNLSCTSSPISPSIADLNKGFRRVQSDGNLEDLAYSSSNNNNNNDEDRLFNYTTDPLPPKRFSATQRCLALETIPSFSLSRHKGLRVEEEDEESDFEDDWEERGDLEEEELKSGSGMNMILRTEEVRVKDGVCGMGFGDNMEGVGGGGGNKGMYLAKGLGVDVCGDGIGGCRGNGGGGGYGYGGGDSNSMNDGDGNNNHDGVEEYYKKMVEENPGNPLFLRNYAQFLYQYKQDGEGAEEYYSRAILADPKDGEVLSQYGKLVWEVHHDQQRASTYFERAVQASPQDSHVHAAYACFLWDTEKDEDGCNEPQCLPNHFHLGAMATTTAGV